MATTEFEFNPTTGGLVAAEAGPVLPLADALAVPAADVPRPAISSAEIVKRAFDLTLAVVGLVILTPLLVVIALAIKLSDPGPVFYRHRRLGRAGKPTYIHKFRTMKAEYSTGEEFGGRTDADVFAALGIPELVAEFARSQKLPQDPRVSRIGQFLRRSSLDELPQLWNILKGDISSVGPRPIVTAELEKYGTGQDTLLSLKPGLTGLWQISGRSDLDFSERVRLDLYYVDNWSLLLDLKIILLTLPAVIQRRGAY